MTMADQPKCELCGEPMPVGEEMFKFHGYSGSCPAPPLPRALGHKQALVDALRARGKGGCRTPFDLACSSVEAGAPIESWCQECIMNAAADALDKSVEP